MRNRLFENTALYTAAIHLALGLQFDNIRTLYSGAIQAWPSAGAVTDFKGFYDELIRGAGKAHAGLQGVCDYLRGLTDVELEERRQAAEAAIRVMGITFRVYSEEEGSIDRNWPFDIIPRIIPASEWRRIETGLKQRCRR